MVSMQQGFGRTAGKLSTCISHTLIGVGELWSSEGSTEAEGSLAMWFIHVAGRLALAASQFFAMWDKQDCWNAPPLSTVMKLHRWAIEIMHLLHGDSTVSNPATSLLMFHYKQTSGQINKAATAIRSCFSWPHAAHGVQSVTQENEMQMIFY